MSKTSNLPHEWIDQLPMDASPFKAWTVSFAAVMLSGLGFLIWHYGPAALNNYFFSDPDTKKFLIDSGYYALLHYCPTVFLQCGLICAFFGCLSFLRKTITLLLLRYALALVYPTMILYTILIWFVLFDIHDAGLPMGNSALDNVTTLKLWWTLSWPAFAVCVYTFWIHLMIGSRSVFAVFTGIKGKFMGGDEILEDLRTHGINPLSRKSLYGSALSHYMILIVIPFLLSTQGCVGPESLPKDEGNNGVPISFVKPKQVKKDPKLALNPNSSTSIKQPEVDDYTDVDSEIEKLTELEYSNAIQGTPGPGDKKNRLIRKVCVRI